MLPYFRLWVFLLIFAQAGHSVVETVVPSTENSSATLQLSAFLVNPNAIVSGDLAEFSVGAASFTSTVEVFHAKIYIYGPGGRLAGTMDFADSAIAGGETQVLTKFWDTSGKPLGAYLAFINATYGNGTATNMRNAEFSIVSTLGATAGLGAMHNASGNGTKVQTGALQTPGQPCTDYYCGEWGECDDGYRSQPCSYLPECSGKDFFRVQKCLQAESAFSLDQKICTAVPQACTTQQQKESYFCACLPTIFITMAFFAFLVLRRKLRRRF